MVVNDKFKFVFIFESLARDFAEMAAKLGLELQLSHENTSGAHLRNFRDLLDDRSAEIIANTYKSDIEAFGYTF